MSKKSSISYSSVHTRRGIMPVTQSIALLHIQLFLHHHESGYNLNVNSYEYQRQIPAKAGAIIKGIINRPNIVTDTASLIPVGLNTVNHEKGNAVSMNNFIGKSGWISRSSKLLRRPNRKNPDTEAINNNESKD